MRTSVIAAALLVASTFSADAATRNNCVERFKYNWGYDTSAKGRIRSGDACSTSFVYGRAQTKGADVIRGPANGAVQIRQVGGGRAVITYAPRPGFAGTDSFVVSMRATTVGRTGAERPETVTRITYNFTVTQ
jgi:hypothetical protein